MPDALGGGPQLAQDTERKETHDSDNTIQAKDNAADQRPRLHFKSDDTLGHTHDHDRQDHTANGLDEHASIGHVISSLSAQAFRPHDSTPATRTGPPRSLSFAHGFPVSPSMSSRTPVLSYFSNAPDGSDMSAEPSVFADLDADYSFTSNKEDQEFRGALEYRDQHERKGKKRQKERETSDGDTWNKNLKKWFQESPKDERPGFDLSTSQSAVTSPNEVEEEAKPEFGSSFFTRRPPRRRDSTHNSSTPTSPAITGKGKSTRRAHSMPRPSGSDSLHEDKEKPLSLHRTTTEHNAASDSPKTPSAANAKWSRLRALIPHLVQQHDGGGEAIDPGPSAVTSPQVNITDELITGGLSTLMLRLWFERDQKGHRRVPVLLHRLRIRVSDSLHPTHRQGSVFRIECEYANGAARWVVYRELRDFLSLHAHYAVTNMYSQNVDKMPEFPKTSLPYFKFLAKDGKDGKDAKDGKDVKADHEDKEGKTATDGNEGKEEGDHRVKRVDHYFKRSDQHDKKKVNKSDFAKMQREALENYLIELIRAVMFHPSSNRLAGFLEISALSIALAQSGGAQYKAGFLRIVPKGDGGGGFGRKSATWRENKEQRWCAIRESYLVVVEEPGELTIWDVFLLDSDFHIERPKRYYRQGIDNFEKLLNPEKPEGEQHHSAAGGHHQHQHQQEHTEASNRVAADNRHLHPPGPPSESGRHSLMSSVKSRVSRIFHMGSRHSQSRTVSDSVSVSSASSAASTASGVATPMLDPSTNVNPVIEQKENGASLTTDKGDGGNGKNQPKKHPEADVSKHTFYIVNSQMRLKLYAKNERQMLQFITALEKTAQSSHYTGTNRFDSFAPIRMNVAAQWLVDGRDYYWNLSRAILLAKETIYIHDWWLSPELQMRRPDKPRYRLDKLLERKAKEGVKIYVILYQEVSNRTTPTDSNYAKQRLTGLHENIMVQRSPSHFQTGTFYWAHHEKMCVIDQTIAFMGGLDLCFGRWDTPQHVLTDDTADTDKSQIWPGKDYSNPRISDFSNLNKPEEDMYDRTKVARMPWHDVAMQIVGQPARDLARHFVQRWNYLLRIKNHSKVMPFLLPPPEFKPGELARLGLTGTCELQICRSAGPWSLGTPGRIEHSIQNAYLKAIQMSEHFVYIENQFFITSTTVSDVKVENNIGDAIVHRIIRAHRDGTPWKCCIVIPVLPGFTFPVDHSDASAIRIILECQNRTIARGPNSIFSRLRKEGIDPDDYIAVFSLRNWAKLRGDVLTTEQVYIHAKVCIVDDRLAIIGSANINERSQRGDRDSELAAVIRDTDMIDSTMAGKPFKVGRFAHTLRVRLMREHLGIDVDALDEEDLMSNEPLKPEYQQEDWDPDQEQVYGDFGDKPGVTQIKKSDQKGRAGMLIDDAKDTIGQGVFAGAETTTTGAAKLLHKLHLAKNTTVATGDEKFLEEERTDYDESGRKEPGFASHAIPTLEEKTLKEQRPRKDSTDQDDLHSESSSSAHTQRASGARSQVGDDTSHTASGTSTNGKSLVSDTETTPRTETGDDNKDYFKSAIRDTATTKPNRKNHWTVPTKRPAIDKDDFEDPISDTFWKDRWVGSAVHNTEIYRKVFHAIPDDLISTWKQYKEFITHHERLNKPARDSSSNEPVARIPSESADLNDNADNQAGGTITNDMESESSKDECEDAPTTPGHGTSFTTNQEESKPRRPARGSEPFEKWERDQMEELLGKLNGHLVLYSNRFLEGEDIANNFLFNADRLLPLPIYN